MNQMINDSLGMIDGQAKSDVHVNEQTACCPLLVAKIEWFAGKTLT